MHIWSVFFEFITKHARVIAFGHTKDNNLREYLVNTENAQLGEKTAKHAIAVPHPYSPPSGINAAAVPGRVVKKEY